MMLHSITTFAASSSDSGILGLSVEAFIVQTITFILAILVLQRFAVKPILAKLQERRETIEKGVELGEQMEKEKAAQDAKREKIMADARAEADKIIADAQDSARQSIQEAEESARKKADAILTQADEQIKQDTARARQKLEKDLAGLVADATEAIIDEKVDAGKDASLMQRALKRSQN